MGFFGWLRDLAQPKREAGADEERLLRWLGIDPSADAIGEATYFTCLKVLAETMGKLPLKLYREEPDGGRTRAEPGRNERLLMERPNPYMAPSVFWGTVEASCSHYGNAYVWIQQHAERRGRRYGGEWRVDGYWPMRPEHVTVLIDDRGIFGNRGALYYRYAEPEGGREYVFRNADVLHFKSWLSWDGVTGQSVRDVLKSMVGGAGKSQEYLSKLYEGGLTASSILHYTGDLSEKNRAKLQKVYGDVLTGARNAGKVVALPIGLTLEPLSYKLTDAQFFELRKYSALQIAAAFGVKPNQINDYEKSSYANSEAQQLAFLVDTVLYRVTQYEQEINYKCLDRQQREGGVFFKFNEKAILRTDSAGQMAAITSAVQNGVYTPNEGRALLDLPNVEGGDVPIVNGNYVPLTSVGAAYGIAPGGGKEGSGDGSEDQR